MDVGDGAYLLRRRLALERSPESGVHRERIARPGILLWPHGHVLCASHGHLAVSESFRRSPRTKPDSFLAFNRNNTIDRLAKAFHQAGSAELESMGILSIVASGFVSSIRDSMMSRPSLL